MRKLTPREIVPAIKLSTAEIAYAADRGISPDDLPVAHALITLDGRYESSEIRQHIWARYSDVLS